MSVLENKREETIKRVALRPEVADLLLKNDGFVYFLVTL